VALGALIWADDAPSCGGRPWKLPLTPSDRFLGHLGRLIVEKGVTPEEVVEGLHSIARALEAGHSEWPRGKAADAVWRSHEYVLGHFEDLVAVARKAVAASSTGTDPYAGQKWDAGVTPRNADRNAGVTETVTRTVTPRNGDRNADRNAGVTRTSVQPGGGE
jgi:hypothetical protein